MRLSDTTIERLSWQERALCARDSDPEAYFPETKPTGVKERCKTLCEVRDECLAYALETGAVGIWGGTSTKERKLMKPAVNPGLVRISA